MLSASSIILIMKLRHRDVLKSLFTKIKDFSQAASAKIKQQRIKAQEKSNNVQKKTAAITRKWSARL